MKLKTKPGTTTAVSQNIQKARQMLGEVGYLHFKPTSEYNVKKGFVAIRAKPTSLYPNVVVLRSRGSFLEIRTDPLFGPPIVRLLRKGLWVPIFVGEPLTHTTDDDLSIHVFPSERTALKELFAHARLS